MAIWQFVLALVPKSWAIANDFNPALLMTEDGRDTSTAWAASRFLPNDFIRIFDDFLPRTESWNENLTIWGNVEKTDIQLWRGASGIEDIQIRFDLRDDIRMSLPRVCEIITSLGCSCFIPEICLIIDPSPTALTELILKSRAAAFVNDPHTFLQTLSEKKEGS